MRAVFILAGLIFFVSLSHADIVECDNGDIYHGKVLLMDEKQVTLQNEIAGTLKIPRQRIVSLSFRDKAAPAAPRTAGTNAVVRPGAVQFDAAAVQKVQNEMLAGATPEATQMFNEMVQGLASGKLNVADIQRQAQSALKELRSMQSEFGDDETAELLNSYAAILESFVRQAPPQGAARPNPAPKVIVPADDD
ncbi:MAG: hypothetical protein ACXW3Z_00560 [Limisphaerales bacterium]